MRRSIFRQRHFSIQAIYGYCRKSGNAKPIQKYIENIIEVIDNYTETIPGKQKMLWDYIKSLRRDNNEVSPENESDQMHPGPKDNAGILNRQYGSVFIRENISY